MIKLVIY